MNKRQKKKMYKKKNGHNPSLIKPEDITEKVISEMLDWLAEGLREVTTKAFEILESACKTVEEAIENIRTMSEEDFEKIIKSGELNARTESLARMLRGEADNEQHNTGGINHDSNN